MCVCVRVLRVGTNKLTQCSEREKSECGCGGHVGVMWGSCGGHVRGSVSNETNKGRSKWWKERDGEGRQREGEGEVHSEWEGVMS